MDLNRIIGDGLGILPSDLRIHASLRRREDSKNGLVRRRDAWKVRESPPLDGGVDAPRGKFD